MVNYKIIPYHKDHGDEIIAHGMNDKLMEIDASFTEIALPIPCDAPVITAIFFLDKISLNQMLLNSMQNQL